MSKIEIVVNIYAQGRQGAQGFERGGTPPEHPKVIEAVNHCIRSKEAANLRPKYVAGLKRYLVRFAHFIDGIPLEKITPENIDEWVNNLADSPSTRASNLGRMSSLFNFCQRHGWVTSNPIKQLEHIRVDPAKPFVFSVEQCQDLCQWTLANKPRYIPFLALCLFCGIRPEEVERLTWQDVDLCAGTIRIDSTIAKTRRQRMIHVPGNALEWLRLGGELPIHKTARRRWERAAREMLGLDAWPQDSLRHTAASMMLARDHDAGKVATELGNSPGILARHYIDLVPESVAAEFWYIRPAGQAPRLPATVQ